MATTGPTTKDFVEIADIRDTLVIMKGGSIRSIVEVGSINFDLKSTDEQIAIIEGFKNFLNYVDFPLQITASSRKLDIQPYLASLDEIQKNTSNELLKVQVYEYARFIKGLTDLANIMSKKFYVIVPFYPVEIGTQSKQGFLGSIKSIFNPKSYVTTLTDQDLENFKIQINQRVSVIIGSISSLGLQGRLLAEDELRNLYYSYYNPGVPPVR